jgi:hypothetical protein
MQHIRHIFERRMPIQSAHITVHFNQQRSGSMKKLVLSLTVLAAAACGTSPVNTAAGGGGVEAAGGGSAAGGGYAAGGGIAATGGGSAAGGGAASGTPTFATIYSSIITVKCAPCHTTPTGIGVQLGHLDMTTQGAAYTNLVNAATAGQSCAGHGTRVIPGNPQMSIMYLKIDLTDPAPCGAKMPFGLPPLPQSDVTMIHDWIQGGAPSGT